MFMAIDSKNKLFFKKWANPDLFFIYFQSFQTKCTIFTTNQCEKCQVHPVYGAGIQTNDLSNLSRLPLGPTRLGLPRLLTIPCWSKEIVTPCAQPLKLQTKIGDTTFPKSFPSLRGLTVSQMV